MKRLIYFIIFFILLVSNSYSFTIFKTPATSIEIGNASTWAACTHREIQIPTAWTTDEITATINQGSLPDGTAYLFVVDADGVASDGYEITLSSSEYASPTITITDPTTGFSTTASTVTVTGTSTKDDALTTTGVSVNGTPATSSDGFATWTASVPISVGPVTLTATVMDSESQTGTDSVTGNYISNISITNSGSYSSGCLKM